MVPHTDGVQLSALETKQTNKHPHSRQKCENNFLFVMSPDTFVIQVTLSKLLNFGFTEIIYSMGTNLVRISYEHDRNDSLRWLHRVQKFQSQVLHDEIEYRC